MDNAACSANGLRRARACILVDWSFLPGNVAIMVPKTDDGRVIVIPWHNVVLVGTTDTPVKSASAEPRPLAEELAFLLDHAGRYLVKNPTADDVLSTFAGLRPLVSGGHEEGSTAELGARSLARHLEDGPRHDHGRKVDDLPQDGRGHD